MKLGIAPRVAAAAVAVVLVAGCGDGTDPTLSAAHDACSSEVDEDVTDEELEGRMLRLADGGKSLIVRPSSTETDPDLGDEFAELMTELMVALSYEMATCVLDEVGASEAMKARFEATRPMDGVQTAEHDEYGYTWSYNPNAGVSLTVERVN